MPAPSSYTEDELALYMQRELGNVASVLGIDHISAFADAVHQVAAQIGSAVDAATDVTYLRLLARRAAWRVAIRHAAAEYVAAIGGDTQQRQLLHQQCMRNHAMAHSDVVIYAREQGYAVPHAGATSASVGVQVTWGRDAIDG